MKKYEACVFDLDGTLLNTASALTYTTNRVLEDFGLHELTDKEVISMVGNGYKKLMERALQAAGDEKLLHYDEALLKYMSYFGKNCMYHVKPYEGIVSMLDSLREKHIRMFVLSNKPHRQTVENIETVFGKDMFDGIMGEGIGYEKKPDPSGLLAIIKKSGIDRGSFLYVGDTAIDIETGHRAGVDAAAVLWGYRTRKELEEYAPEYLVDSPGELACLFHESVV